MKSSNEEEEHIQVELDTVELTNERNSNFVTEE
jgi:hypothetical protein